MQATAMKHPAVLKDALRENRRRVLSPFNHHSPAGSFKSECERTQNDLTKVIVVPFFFHENLQVLEYLRFSKHLNTFVIRSEQAKPRKHLAEHCFVDSRLCEIPLR